MKNSFINKRFKNDRYMSISFYLVAINILVYLLCFLKIDILDIPLKYALSLVPSLVVKKYFFWQFITYFFTHIYPMHLFFNSIQILFFGIPVERAIGSKEFLLYYCITGFIGGLFTFLVWYLTGSLNNALMGASGSIFAVMILYAMCYPSSYILVFFFLPVRAPFFVLFLIAIELFYLLSPMTGLNISHATHLFSLLAGIVYIIVRMRINFFKEWKNMLFYKG